MNTHKSNLFLYCIKIYKEKLWKNYKPTDFHPQLSHLIPHWQYKGLRKNVQHTLILKLYAKKVDSMICNGIRSENQCRLNQKLPLVGATAVVNGGRKMSQRAIPTEF